jgi:hypothetical protein
MKREPRRPNFTLPLAAWAASPLSRSPGSHLTGSRAALDLVLRLLAIKKLTSRNLLRRRAVCKERRVAATWLLLRQLRATGERRLPGA